MEATDTVFDDHVRRQHDAGVHGMAAGVKQGDGAAVGVAHQHRPLDAQRVSSAGSTSQASRCR
jgi:hypothetical protein